MPDLFEHAMTPAGCAPVAWVGPAPSTPGAVLTTPRAGDTRPRPQILTERLMGPEFFEILQPGREGCVAGDNPSALFAWMERALLPRGPVEAAAGGEAWSRSIR